MKLIEFFKWWYPQFESPNFLALVVCLFLTYLGIFTVGAFGSVIAGCIGGFIFTGFFWFALQDEWEKFIREKDQEATNIMRKLAGL